MTSPRCLLALPHGTLPAPVGGATTGRQGRQAETAHQPADVARTAAQDAGSTAGAVALGMQLAQAGSVHGRAVGLDQAQLAGTGTDAARDAAEGMGEGVDGAE